MSGALSVVTSEQGGLRRAAGRLSSYRWVWALLPLATFTLLFVAVPLLTIALRSFTQSRGAEIVLDTFTLQNYLDIFLDAYYWRILGRTLYIGLVVTLLSLPIGYLLAYYITRVARSRVTRRFVYMVVLAPLFTSAIVRAFGWIVVLGREGMVNQLLVQMGLVAEPVQFLFNTSGVVIGLVHILCPFMVLTISSVLQNIDPTLEAASSDLGAAPWKTFTTVTLPLSMPGILAGSLIVFSLTVSSYVAPAALGGGRVKVFASLVFDQFMARFNWAFGSALAIVLLVSSLAVVGAYSRILRTDL